MSKEKTQKEVLRKEAEASLKRLKKATPKRWTGKTRKGWKIEPSSGGRGYGYRIVNNTEAIRYLDQGTKAHGPVTATFLYIPLTASAAKGWRKSLKYGKDYILKKRVRGIKAMRIVATERARAKGNLKESMRGYLNYVINKG